MLTLQDHQKDNAIAEAIHQAQRTTPEDPLSPWLLKLSAAYPGDIGILAPLILNLVRLTPGQAMFLPAGRLHAYLEGVGIELMANSDNVLRGGLTSKHIDQDELMGALRFESRDPGVMTAQSISQTEARFSTTADEFILAKLTVAPGANHEAPHHRNVEILLLTSGQATLETITTGEQLHVKRGDSILIPAAAGSYRISGQAEIYKATVPETI
jgi:mannose-6-phosphate isomerase